GGSRDSRRETRSPPWRSSSPGGATSGARRRRGCTRGASRGRSASFPSRPRPTCCWSRSRTAAWSPSSAAHPASNARGRRPWTAGALDAGRPCELEVGAAKAYGSDALRRLFMHAHQVHGAIGFSTEHDLQLFTRRAKAAELAWGSATLHRERVARAMGL